jgi:hypothetical protein
MDTIYIFCVRIRFTSANPYIIYTFTKLLRLGIDGVVTLTTQATSPKHKRTGSYCSPPCSPFYWCPPITSAKLELNQKARKLHCLSLPYLGGPSGPHHLCSTTVYTFANLDSNGQFWLPRVIYILWFYESSLLVHAFYPSLLTALLHSVALLLDLEVLHDTLW